MTGSPQTDPRLDAAAKALVRYQSSGLCDENYPEQCLDCDCFHAQTKAATGHGFKRELEQVQAVLAAADAVDEASGVRRVTAQELADNFELARVEERQRIAGEILLQAEKCTDHWPMPQGDCWVCQRHGMATRCARIAVAADSPVGGVS